LSRGGCAGTSWAKTELISIASSFSMVITAHEGVRKPSNHHSFVHARIEFAERLCPITCIERGIRPIRPLFQRGVFMIDLELQMITIKDAAHQDHPIGGGGVTAATALSLAHFCSACIHAFIVP